ncbi:MAG: excinuclease ABC subunit UvrC [Candidatus Omnitrophica bacterium]|nr:excinuclease ABC subunit UvrC [Candidatus Omnitrophota bacterium]
MDIKEKINNLPETAGVYLIKDRAGEVIYIGKAASLRKRVTSHFQKSALIKEKQLQEKSADIEYISTGSEAEALLWEASLIKEKQPRYNVSYRDDKSYPFLKITTGEKFPRVFISRGKKEKNALYFGPYTDAALLREALKIMRKVFPYRSCKNLPKKPCLYYAIGLCPAPCADKISEADYKLRIREVCLFLERKGRVLENILAREMSDKAGEKKFEEAAQIRDQIAALGNLKELRFGKDTILYELKKLLELKRIPLRIEAFDVSHIAGRQAVGAMVSFYQGIPDKNNYRRFKIRIASGTDDFAMMREIVSRRYRRLRDEDISLPDLVFIDGGKAHLEAAYSKLKELGFQKLDVISLAKKEEYVYTLKRKNPLKLPRDSRPLQLLERIRDEAHRFAITYHKRLRKTSFLGEGRKR